MMEKRSAAGSKSDFPVTLAVNVLAGLAKRNYCPSRKIHDLPEKD